LREPYGACCSALLVIAWPVLDMSLPAPAVVWQAPSKGATPSRMNMVRATNSFARMVMILPYFSV
jgi:hypothetical protein